MRFCSGGGTVKVLRMTTDQLATDDRIAELLMEYAAVLGRAGTTDTVELPVARGGQSEKASILLGPASQITLTELHDEADEQLQLPGVDDVITDLQNRIDRYSGDRNVVAEDAPEHPDDTFPDFGTY
jgi:hypothetical protein